MVYIATLRTLLVRSGSSLLLATLCACGGQPSSFVTNPQPGSANAQGAPAAGALPPGSGASGDADASRQSADSSPRQEPSAATVRGEDPAGLGQGGASGRNSANAGAVLQPPAPDRAGPVAGGQAPAGPASGASPFPSPDHGAPRQGHPGDGASTPGGDGGIGGGGETLPSVPKRSFETVQKAAGKIDILWVIDDSASMEPEQRNLAINFNKFITQLAATGHDFHTAVTTTDVCQDRMPRALEDRVCPVREPQVKSSRHLRGAFVGPSGRTVLKSTDSDLISRFNSYVRQGTRGSSFEHGLTAAHMAIDRSLHGRNDELVRNDAFLSVIVLSDEEDDGIGLGMVDAFSNHNYWQDGITRYRYTDDDLISYLKEIKGEGHFSISGIVGTRDRRGKLCSSRVASPQEEGTQYIKAAAKTGGIIRSVCELDWADSMLKIAQDVAAQAAQVNLPSVPDEATIEVTVNGVTCTDWTYNSANNAVKFNAGKVPAAGAKIKISYAEPQA